MRVTQNMLSNQMITNINRNLGRMESIQQHLATGTRLNKPSDDPVGVNFSLRYRSQLTANDQYQRNLDSAVGWIDYNDTVLNQLNSAMQRARELALQGATDSTSAQARQAIAAEIDEIKGQVLEIANSQFNGKYIFNGQKTDQKPFPTAESYQQPENTFDNGSLTFEVSRGMTIDINLHAGQVFGNNGDASNVFNVLQQLSDGLRNPNLGESNEQINQAIGLMDQRQDIILERWAEVGAKANRVDLIENRLKDTNLNLQSLLSKNEDTDYAAAITNLNTAENVYRASLAAGARIIQPSLMDFLR